MKLNEALMSCLPQEKDQCGLVYLELQVPVQLSAAVKRHHQNLVELSVALQTAGVPEATIRDQLEAAISSYREALSAAIADITR